MKKTQIPARDIVVVGASTGGVEALTALVAGLPSGFPAAVLIVMHIGGHDSVLPALLARACALPVKHALHGELLQPGRVLVAPPDLHLTVARRDSEFLAVLSRSARENHTRPAIDPLFRSAAAAFGPGAIGVILTGALDDGTSGLAAIKACGGQAVVQSPDEAFVPGMPCAAIESVDVDRVLKLDEMGAALVEMVDANLRRGGGAPGSFDVPSWLRLENSFATGNVDMASLELIAAPSTFTCPECHGTLWELKDQHPQRFRCHTGHAFSGKSLLSLQGDLVEESIWSAVRALQEKEKLLRRLADEALRANRVEAASEYAARAGKVQRDAEVLRRVLTETVMPAG